VAAEALSYVWTEGEAMTKVTPINEDQQFAIGVLERLLKLAREGKMLGLAVVYLDADLNPHVQWAGADEGVRLHVLSAGVADLHQRIFSVRAECAIDSPSESGGV
jgi:hypothetical protein